MMMIMMLKVLLLKIDQMVTMIIVMVAIQRFYITVDNNTYEYKKKYCEHEDDDSDTKVIQR